MALSETLGSRPGLRLIRYSMAERWRLFLISSRFSTAFFDFAAHLLYYHGMGSGNTE